jgi:hypothetical protein
VSGLPQDQAGLNGRYRRDGSAGGRAAYKSRKGKHLFWHPEEDQWRLASNPYDPAKKGSIAFANIAARGGPVPTGARAWRVVAGGKFVDRELTVREVGAEEAAALDAADAADAERRRLEEAAQADRVVRRPLCPRWPGATLSFRTAIGRLWLPLLRD